MVLYVGNIYFGLSEDQLREVFESYGVVDSVKIVKDRETGKSRGFAFVDMNNENEAKLAMKELNGSEVSGRNIIVNHATKQN